MAAPTLRIGNATGQLGETLLELLAVVVGVGVVDLGLDLGDAAVDVGAAAGTFDDGGLVLGDDDLAGLAEQIEGGVLELEADLFGDDLAAGEDGHVLEHRLAAVAEAGGLDRGGGERATDLVDDQGGQGFALDVLGDDQQRLARLHDLFEHGHDVAHRGDLGADEQDVGIVEDGFHALGVGDEVRGDVALVEAHALDEVHVHAEGLGLLDGDDAVLADLVDGLGDLGADLGIGSRDRCHVGDLVLVRRDVGGLAADGLDRRGDAGLDALLQRHGVGAGRDVAEALADHRPREHRGGGGAVTGDVVGLLGDLFDELGADLFVGVLELDLLGDGDTIVGDRGSAPLLVEHHVAAFGAERDPHGVGELVHARFESAPSLFVERDDLGHLESCLPEVTECVLDRATRSGGPECSFGERATSEVVGTLVSRLLNATDAAQGFTMGAR